MNDSLCFLNMYAHTYVCICLCPYMLHTFFAVSGAVRDQTQRLRHAESVLHHWPISSVLNSLCVWNSVEKQRGIHSKQFSIQHWKLAVETALDTLSWCSFLAAALVYYTEKKPLAVSGRRNQPRHSPGWSWLIHYGPALTIRFVSSGQGIPPVPSWASVNHSWNQSFISNSSECWPSGLKWWKATEHPSPTKRSKLSSRKYSSLPGSICLMSPLLWTSKTMFPKDAI